MKTYKWDDRFITLACEVATWSRDPSTQVGCVIVREDKTVAGLGFNGFPRGMDDGEDLYANREVKYQRVLHAEMNAVLNSQGPVKGCTAYVSAPTCSNCGLILVQSGIVRVVVKLSPLAVRWQDSIDLAKGFYQEAGVGYEERD